MPRLPRVYIEGALYYITSQGNQNRNLFNDKMDYDNYLELLAKYKKEHGFKLFAFVLLPRHVHLLIELKSNVTISAIMHDLNSLYTKVYNGRYQRKGHLFQGRFKSILIEKEPYLAMLTRYAHLNPKRSDMVGSAQEYAFSSYKLYISDPVTEDAVKDFKLPDIKGEIAEVFSSFKEADKQKAYEEYVTGITDEENFEIGRLLHRKAFVGSREFIENIKEKMEAASKEEQQVRVRSMPYKFFIIAGTLVIIALGIVTFYLYARNLETSKRFNLFMYEFGQNFQDFSFASPEAKKEEVVITLDGSKWDILLTSRSSDDSTNDVLTFEDDKVVSSILFGEGFTSSYYSVTTKKDGSVIWETMQTKEDGSTATWYGVWSGDKMKGILSQHMAGEEKIDYSFVSKKRSRVIAF
ncbi:transposase [Candidatus Omnitrophota bacterium]